ncbi:hypothetical protein G6F62_012992 [Rhizopus arrhizus]|nr:hypothetical protein G6F62_012992 [Rhizopus arrhizus]
MALLADVRAVGWRGSILPIWRCATAEIAPCRLHAVPVRRTQLLGQETGQRRFATQAQQRPQPLADRADAIGGPEADRLVHRRRPHGGQQLVDQLAHRQRFAVGDEVRLAGAGRARCQGFEGEDVRPRGVVDVGGIDLVVAIAHQAQATLPCTLGQARHQLLVARPPDQARAQRYRRQRRIVGGQHALLGNRLDRKRVGEG